VIFFVPYVLFEIPANVLMKKFTPHAWLAAKALIQRATCAPSFDAINLVHTANLEASAYSRQTSCVGD